MTVICPSCDARFRDPPAEVLDTQPLQCGKCEHRWTPGSGDADKFEAPSIVPDIDDLIGDVEEPIRSGLPVVIEQDEAEEIPVPIVPIYVDRPEPPKATLGLRRLFVPLLALAVSACVCGLVVFKEAVVATYPQTEKYYQTAGLETANTGLRIANVVTSRNVKNGISQLIVRGEIANIADNTVPVPPIQLVMLNNSQSSLYEWTVAAAKSELKAGETSRFTAVTKDYPKDAVNVEVTFAR